MRLRALFMAATCCTLALCSGVSARTLLVPGEYGTLSAANAAARDGDTILVASGAYRGEDNTNIVLSRRIIWMSEEGPGETVIDGEAEANRRAFYMVGASTNGTQIHGFTITGMTLYSILDSSTADTRISNCVIMRSVNASNNQGVGIKVSQAQRFSIDHCIFQGLEAGSSGAGMLITSSATNARIWDCIFDGLNSHRSGGGIHVTVNSDADIGNCIFKDNYASIDGGGFAVSQSSRATVRNCTFINNTADGMGGGFYKGSDSNPTVINSIFYGNSAATGSQLCQQANGGTITISYCTVQNAQDGQEEGGNWRGQNIDNRDPRISEGREPLWGLNWFYLNPASPCVDAGSAQASEVGMDTLFTNPDFSLDEGVVDVGFHYDPDSYLRVGTLRGTVTVALNGNPLPGAIVKATRRIQTSTDENGNWILPDFKIGPIVLNFTREGFLDSTILDTLEEDEDLRIDLSMLHTDFIPSIGNVDVQVVQDSSTQIDFTVINSGSGTLQYTATPRLVGEADRDPWVLRESLNIGQNADDDRINGFAVVDSLFYVSGSNGNDSNMVYIVDREGAVLDSFQQAGTSRYGFKQMAYDGELIWGSGEGALYGFTKEGILASQFESPINPTENIAWDPDRQVLWVSGITTDILSFDRNGMPMDTLRGFRSLRKYGLEYWPNDPDGHGLYIMHRPSENLSNLTKVDPSTRDSLYVTSVQVDGGYPLLDCKILSYDLFSVVFVAVANIPRAEGNDRMDIWQLAGNTVWMQINPRAGEVPAGGEQPFSLVLNMMGFPPGQVYEGQILFTHNALDFEYRLPIFVEVRNRIIPSVGETEVALPDKLAIETISPNPFNGSVRISFSMPAAGKAVLGIYDLAGREVTRLVDSRREAGTYSVSLNAETWPSGIYIAKLTSGSEVRTAKMALMK